MCDTALANALAARITIHVKKYVEVPISFTRIIQEIVMFNSIIFRLDRNSSSDNV